MTLFEDLNLPVPGDVLTAPLLEDLTLHIDLRVHLDEITQVDAALLRNEPLPPPSRMALCRLACGIYDGRRLRDRLIDRPLFGEPAWDMLLALYCLPSRGEFLTVTALSYAATCPGSTGHRWQAVLTEEGLMEKGPQGVDGRKQFVQLTTLGRLQMEGYLTRLYYLATPAPPNPEAAGGGLVNVSKALEREPRK